MQFTTVDLFAGIGGFRIAIEQCGGNTIAFSEIDSDAINYYCANHLSNHSNNLGDITNITDLPKHDLLTAGVPCQSWSIAGKNLGFNDKRGQLWNNTLSLLESAKPKAFIFENVKGLADPRNIKALSYIMERIKNAGYFASYYLLNSKDYGVPQSRVRVYIIGFNNKQMFDKFKLPLTIDTKYSLADYIEDDVVQINLSNNSEFISDHNLFGDPVNRTNSTGLSANNNGFNDYFLFNDLRNGNTTIHTWDIIETTQKQKNICLTLLKNRRKKDFGPLDGNPLSLDQLRSIDNTITEEDIRSLVKIGIIRKEEYAYSINTSYQSVALSEDELYVLEQHNQEILIPDKIIANKSKRNINPKEVLKNLNNKGVVRCIENRYDFSNTKISSGINGISRIFLPTSSIFPTLVASDSNDYVTPISIKAIDKTSYRDSFIKHVVKTNNFRKLTKKEACRIQGFPDGFILPESRSRWMKLLGNSVSVPLMVKLVNSIVDTGIFFKKESSSSVTITSSPIFERVF
ncbi:MAG: DNA cytosine methyltransferase [Oscillospiraceae bacterium]|jgi:DNA (cytosine-5)-methyltransferase 1|nr:DNA cytosine methyltransferase [Oscillospiraceae bacterium]